MDEGIKKLNDKIKLDEQITNEQFKTALKGAHKARAYVTYFVWKVLQEMHPEIDATKVMEEAYRRFGVYSGAKWGEIGGADEALIAQTSKGGYLVFEQEFIACTPDYAQKNFHACPHMEAFTDLGATAEEKKTLCQIILSAGDYGNMEPHDAVTLEFKSQIGAGDDCCAYCVSKVK